MANTRLIILYIVVNSILVYCDTLKGLVIIHRHGNRSPQGFYKPSFHTQGDPYANLSYWPGGIGHLTNRGRRRMYNVGQLLRKRYDHFLSDNIREVELRSSDVDRTIESIILVSNALYKPTGDWNWSQYADQWQPIAVHTVPVTLDSMLNPDSVCDAAEIEHTAIKESERMVNEEKKFANLTEKMAKITISSLGTIWDCLTCEIAEGLEIPEYFSPELITGLREYYKLYFLKLGATRRLQRLRAGVFLNELVTKIDQMISRSNATTENAKKLYIYSSHDKVISTLLYALQIHDHNNIEFGAALIFELHQHTLDTSDPMRSHSIRIYYSNQTESEPYLLKIPSCSYDELCTFEQFSSSIDDLTLTHEKWVKECAVTPLVLNYKQKSNAVTIVVFSSVLIFMAIVTLFVRKLIRSKRKSTIQQETIVSFGTF